MVKDTIEIIVSDAVPTRGSGAKQAKPMQVEVLAENVNLFIGQIGGILEKTPEKLGKFHLDELEVHAEITGTGQVVLFGVGGELGASGGLRFVFRRTQASN